MIAVHGLGDPPVSDDTKSRWGMVWLVVLFPLALWRGLVGSVLWAWFIVPTFGAPSLGAVRATAVMLAIGYFMPFRLNDEPKTESAYVDRQTRELTMMAVGPLLCLLVAALLRVML
jgi:hypothetical protein